MASITNLRSCPQPVHSSTTYLESSRDLLYTGALSAPQRDADERSASRTHNIKDAMRFQEQHQGLYCALSESVTTLSNVDYSEQPASKSADGQLKRQLLIDCDYKKFSSPPVTPSSSACVSTGASSALLIDFEEHEVEASQPLSCFQQITAPFSISASSTTRQDASLKHSATPVECIPASECMTDDDIQNQKMAMSKAWLLVDQFGGKMKVMSSEVWAAAHNSADLSKLSRFKHWLYRSCGSVPVLSVPKDDSEEDSLRH